MCSTTCTEQNHRHHASTVQGGTITNGQGGQTWPGTCTQISYETNQTWQIIEPIQPAAMHEAVPPIETFQMIQPVQTFETFDFLWMGGGDGGGPPPLSASRRPDLGSKTRYSVRIRANPGTKSMYSGAFPSQL